MKGNLKYIYVFVMFLLPSISFSQSSAIMKMMDKGEFDNVLQNIEQAYKNDTLNKDRNNLLYHYYINGKNLDRDTLMALYYAKQYNNLETNKKDKIATAELAKTALTYVYKSKDVSRFNIYISVTEEYPALNKEAKRIRNQLAYEQVKQSEDIKQYEDFINNYPDAIQISEAKQWLNERVLNEILKSGDIDSLKNFANRTTNMDFKQKALDEVDRLSFKKALESNTIVAYNKYIKDFPNGQYVKVAKNKMNSVKYEQYVSDGNLSDLIYFVEHNPNDNNYQTAFEKLKLMALEHLSIKAMKIIQSTNNNTEYLNTFCKRYVSDYSLSSIEKIIEAFPEIKNESYILEAKKKAQTIHQLLTKSKLTMEDYKKNKSLFYNLNSHQTMLLFKRFISLSEQNATNRKNFTFNLNNDIHYINYKYSKSKEFNFTLTEKPNDLNDIDKPNKENTNLDNISSDARYSSDKKAIVFSLSNEDGFDYDSTSNNKDIFVSINQDGVWQKPFPINKPVNSRFNETNPVLSPDMKTLWFSSDRDLNFGKLDIYVSYREDVNDWNSWSMPMLLSEDFNTEDNDYVIRVEDNLVVVNQDDSFAQANDVYLSGKTDLNIFSGKIMDKEKSPIQAKVVVMDKENLNTENIVYSNDRGFFAFIKPEKEMSLIGQKNNYLSFISNSDTIMMYYIEEMVNKQELITRESPFEEKNSLTLSRKGTTELYHLAQSLDNSPYILTIGVHVGKDSKKYSSMELSQKQADVIKEFMIKNNVNVNNIVVAGYGNTKQSQGMDNTDNIEISIINK
jgi:hypothetical protein